jgi:CheY-like chemotaxis protein
LIPSPADHLKRVGTLSLRERDLICGEIMQTNILFVEDQKALRMTVGDRLQNEGYQMDYAVDGDEGLLKATTLPFDLIILDVMLPGRDGFLRV